MDDLDNTGEGREENAEGDSRAGSVFKALLDSEYGPPINVPQNIYSLCDRGNTNSVPVSNLIERIKIYMPEELGLDALIDLENALDPNASNVHVDYETFCKEMTLWVSKIERANLGFNYLEERNTNNGMGEPYDKNCMTLTNRNLDSSFLNTNLKLDIQNISNASSSSYLDKSNQMDPIYVQEQLRELEHQNRKLTLEVDDIRHLLVLADEQSYNQQKQLSEMSTKLIQAQKCNEELENNIKANDKLSEASGFAQNEIRELQKMLTLSNKEVNCLEQRIATLEEDKQNLENQIDKQQQCENTLKDFIMEMQSEMNLKNQTIILLEGSATNLKSQLTDKQQMLTHVSDVNEQLKLEKSKLEENFRKTLTQRSLSNRTRSHTSSSLSEHFDSDSGCVINAVASYNTSNVEASSEDEAFWKLHMVQHSPRPSLESEILQANIEEMNGFDVSTIHKQYQEMINKLQKKASEYQTTIQESVKEINTLKQQIADESNFRKNDSQKQYIQIVELVETTEVLNKSLEPCSIIHSDEVRNYNAIEAERDKLLKIIEEKQLSTSNGYLQDLQIQFEQLLETTNEVSKKNSILLEENLNLRNEVSSLTAVLHKLSNEKSNKCLCGNYLAEKDIGSCGFLQYDNNEFQGCDFPETDLSDADNVGNSYKTRIGGLSNEIFNLTNVNAEMSQTLNERNIQISTLKEMIQLQNAQIALLQTEKSNIFDKLHEMKSKKNNCMDEIEKLKEDVRKLEDECGTLKITNDLSKDQLESLNDEYYKEKEYGVNLCADYNVLLNLKQGLQKRNDTLVSEANVFQQKIHDLQGQLELFNAEKHGEIAALKSKIITLEDLNSNLSGELDASNSKISTLEGTNIKLNSELDVILNSSKSGNERSCVYCKKLESDKNNLQNTITALQSEIGNHKNKSFNRMSLIIDKHKERIEELERNNAVLQKKVDENFDTHTTKNSIISNENKTLKQTLSEQEDVMQRLNNCEVEKEILTKTNSILEGKVQSLQKEKQKLADADQNLMLVTKDLRRVKNEKVGLQEESKQNKAKIKELEHVLNNTQLAVKHTVREKLTAIKEKKTIETQYHKLQEDFQKLENDNKDLVAAHNQIYVAYNACIKKKEQKKHVFEKEIQKLGNDNAELEEQVLLLKGDLQKLEKELASSENELFEANTKLSYNSSHSAELTKHVKAAKMHLKEKRKRLARSTLTLVNSWRLILINDAIALEDFYKDVPVNTETPPKMPLDEELNKLQHQINLTTSLLDTLINLDFPKKGISTVNIVKKYSELPDSLSSSSTTTPVITLFKLPNSKQKDFDLLHCEDSYLELLNQEFESPLAGSSITDSFLESSGVLCNTHRVLDRQLSEPQVPWKRTFIFLVIVVIFIICCMFMKVFHTNNGCSIPWQWTTWEEILSPFITRNYRNTPPT